MDNASDAATTDVFRIAADASEESIIVTEATLDAPGPRILYVNPAFEQLTGYTAAEVLGATPRLLQGPETERAVLDRMRRRLAAGEDFAGNIVNYRRDGTPFVMEWRVRASRDAAGRVARYVSTQRGTDRERPPHDAAGQGMHRQIFDQHNLPMLLLDPQTGAIADANRGAEHFYGYSRDTLQRMRIQEINMLSAAEVRAEMARAQSEQSGYFVFRHRLANGEVRAVEVHSSPITVAGREYLHSIIHDISERDRLADEVRRRLYYDPLTGLANRSLFQDRLEQALGMAHSDGWPLALLRVDVDRFRRLNYLWGQPAADRLLVALGERLHGLITPQSTVARTGIDEFSILVPRIAVRHGVQWLAERIMAALRQPLQLDGHPVAVTASIGVILAPDHGGDARGLIDGVDATVLALKRRGGDAWGWFEPESVGHASERMFLAHEIDEALAGDQLRLAWQPTFHLPTGTPAGGEFLVRWAHPQRGWVPPDRFIAAAEEAGKIGRVGEWVLHRAIRLAAGAGSALQGRIGINVSVQQLRSADFVDTVRRMLADAGLGAHRLELELTEGAFVEESTQLIERLQELRGAGIAIAIDDFGTGFSSLQYLKRLPIDRIKIDRAFVTDIDTDADNQALVTTIVTLAERFGLDLTAEGIETAEASDKLVELGCAWGQGYHWAKPMLVGDELPAPPAPGAGP